MTAAKPNNLQYPRPANIPPEVWEADCDELIAAGWIETPRNKIPANWRELDETAKMKLALREKARRYKEKHRKQINARERRKYQEKTGAKKRIFSQIHPFSRPFAIACLTV